jgi:hypothetical protein
MDDAVVISICRYATISTLLRLCQGQSSSLFCLRSLNRYKYEPSLAQHLSPIKTLPVCCKKMRNLSLQHERS